MNRNIAKNLLIVVVVFFFGMALSYYIWGIKGKTSNSKSEKLVIKFGNSGLTKADIKSYLDFGSRKSGFTRGIIKRKLDELVTIEVLAKEAQRQSIDKSPKIKRTIHQVLMQSVLSKETKKKLELHPITEKEINQYYQQNINLFHRGHQIRVADIFIANQKEASPKETAKKHRFALQVIKETRSVEGKRFGYGSLVRKYSEKHPLFSLGNTGYFDKNGTPVGISTHFSKEAFKLTKIGQINKELIKTDKGWHIVMLVGRRPPVHRRYETVKRQIKQKLLTVRQQEIKESYIVKLKEDSNILYDSDLIDELLIGIKQSSNSPKQGPPPIPNSND